MAQDYPAAMEDYVQLPLTATALRKWLRFSEKGGIGQAVSLADRLAESGTDDLMFMEGEPIIVLMQLGDGKYLGSCEGVVGIFHESDVRFLTRLKKPTFTKKPVKSENSTPSFYQPSDAQPYPTTSPRLNNLRSPATPHAISPFQTPYFSGERRVFSAPASASALLALQGEAHPVSEYVHPAASLPPLPGPGTARNSESHIQIDSFAAVKARRHPIPTETASLRSPSALEDNDDILSSYVYDHSEDSENPSNSDRAQRQADSWKQISSPDSLEKPSTEEGRTSDIRRNAEGGAMLLAPMSIGRLAGERTDIEYLKEKPKLSQRVDVPAKVQILPNLPAGVSLKQLRERSSPRFPLSPRSISDSATGVRTSSIAQPKPSSSVPHSSLSMHSTQDITPYVESYHHTWSEPVLTPLASPVPSSFVSADSPLSPLSPAALLDSEYESLAHDGPATSALPSGFTTSFAAPVKRHVYDPRTVHSPRYDELQDTRSTSSASSSSRGLSHSRSLSSLTRAGSLMFQRRPSLPNRTDSTGESPVTEGLVELSNAQFQFVQPQGVESEGGSPQSTVDSFHTMSSGKLVTRPSDGAKERVRSIYVTEPPYPRTGVSPVIDRYGFIHNQHIVLSGQEADVPTTGDPTVLEAYRARELKWVTIMSTLSARSARSSSKVKKLANYGIPDSVRGKAWTYLADAASRRKETLYHDLCARGELPQSPQIAHDISACFHDHSHYTDEDSIGRQDLQSVLQALLNYLPNLAYEQGLCHIAGMLLLHMEAETAFWLLVTIVTDYLPTYFTKDRQGSLLDANIISYILQHGEPELHRHLNTRDGELVTILQGWLASAFVRTLPWATQLRVMDLFFFGDRPSQLGVRVGLAVMDLLRDHLLARRQNPARFLQAPPADLLSPSCLLPSLLTIKLPNRTLRKATKWAHGQCPSI